MARLVPWLAAAAVVPLLASAACSERQPKRSAPTSRSSAPAKTIVLSSPAFAAETPIPRQYTCDGANESPPLSWTGIPAGGAELVLTVEDPDAPNGTFVHWVLYGIDPSTSSLDGGSSGRAVEGVNGAGRSGYTGPCPPRGTQHRYVFVLSAVSRATNLAKGASAAQVRSAIAGTTMAQGQLVARYGR